MKKFTFLILLSFYALVLHGQTQADTAKVLQRCIDLNELMSFYPRQDEGNYEQLIIMQHGISFSSVIKVFKFDKPVLLKSKQEVIREGNPYFLFYNFNFSSDKAHVSFCYYFNKNDQESSLLVNLTLQKTGTDWAVLDSQFERR